MRKALAFYTVLVDRTGYPVKYTDQLTYRVKTLVGPFSDPGEASQEFRSRIGGTDSCYLDNRSFEAKGRALAQLRRDEASREGRKHV